MTLKRIATSLGSIAVEIDGAGPVVLMLHGSGSSRGAFDQQVAVLSAERTVIRWDAPGYGDSQDPTDTISLNQYGRAVAEVVRSVASDRPVDLVGVSWGGLVAINAVLCNPSMFRSLALIGSNFGQANDAAARARTQKRIDKFRGSKADYVAARVDSLSHGHPQSQPFPAVAARMMATTRLPGFQYALQSMLDSGVINRLPEITVPKLLMWGDVDEVAGDVCRQVADRRLVDIHHEIQGAGHLANQEKPEAVNMHLKDFWATLSPA